jgi:fructose-specific phosphotransferase system component IIB
MKILCVTSCFSGLVSTYLAAEALLDAGEQLGHEILVETQGPAGSAPFAESDIEQADGVIFAVDIPIEGRERFAGKPYLEGAIAPSIHAPRELINRLVAEITEETAQRVSIASTVTEVPAVADESTSDRGFFAKLFGRGR